MFVFVLMLDFVFVLIFDFVFVFEKKEACCQPLHLLYARGGKDARGRAGGSATQMHSLGPPRCIVLYLYLYYIVLYCIALYCIVLLCIPSVLGDALYCICICIALHCIVLLCIPSVFGDASKRIFHALKRFGMCQDGEKEILILFVNMHLIKSILYDTWSKSKQSQMSIIMSSFCGL